VTPSAPADELTAWLRLEQTEGVGPATARKLLAAFGLPENIFAASHAALCKVVPERIAQALKSPPAAGMQQQIERTLEWAAQPENRLLTLADDYYPKALLDIPDPPLLLYAKGRAELLNAPSLAIVGSRQASAQGVKNAEHFARAMSHAGLAIASGLALGIDAAAHRGGLDGAGSTIAVIGTGADIVYPARNRELAHRIAFDGGCIVSECPLGTPAVAANFPRRNRIISGMAKGVLVVEAAAQSGSLITARMAAEQGREVFAIPGSIHSPLAKGCHQLIKQGAKLVESAQDVLEELRLLPAPANASTATSAAAPAEVPADAPAAHLLAAIGFDAASADQLAERTGLDAAALAALLLMLELEGRIERLPDGSYRRLAG